MIRDLMIGGASVEDTLTLWASSLRDVKQRIRRLFTQERVAAAAGQVLGRLLGNQARKAGRAGGRPGRAGCRRDVWVASRVRGVGWGRRGRAIPAGGASTRSWAGGSG